MVIIVLYTHCFEENNDKHTVARNRFDTCLGNNALLAQITNSFVNCSDFQKLPVAAQPMRRQRQIMITMYITPGGQNCKTGKQDL